MLTSAVELIKMVIYARVLLSEGTPTVTYVPLNELWRKQNGPCGITVGSEHIGI